MKEVFYKYLSLSLGIIVIWMSYLFFDYFLESKGLFNGFGLMINFMVSCFTSLILGVIVILIRFTTLYKQQKEYHIINFLYVFAGIFNLIIFLLYLCAASLKILNIKSEMSLYFFSTLFISSFIICNIINKIKKIR